MIKKMILLILRKKDDIVDLEKDPKTNEYKPKE